MSRLISLAVAGAMLAAGAALAKLPPPTPEEEAAAAAKKEQKAAQEKHEKEALTKVQDRIASQYHKEHGTRPSPGAGEQTSTGKLPRYVSDPKGQGAPSPAHPYSQESHSAPTR